MSRGSAGDVVSGGRKLESGLQREHMKTLLIILAIATGALTTASSAAAVAAFVTPHKNAYCGITEGEAPLSLICWRPADGLTLEMKRFGRPHKSIHPSNRGYFDRAPGRLLRFGQSWRLSGWACVSRSAGLTCTNRSGHGWWLGRLQGSRLF
jgi:hypothetical protein